MPLLPAIYAANDRGSSLAAGDVIYIEDSGGNPYGIDMTDFFGNIPVAVVAEVSDTILGTVEIIKESADAELILSCYHDTEATTSILVLRKADNTLAAPALVDDNAVLGAISFQGHDGSGWHEGARIEARIQGTPSDGTDMPTELTFWTVPDASATAVQAVTIDSSQNIGIGGTATQRLDVIKSQDATTALRIYNATAGTAARSAFLVQSNSCDGTLQALSGSYTTSNQYTADSVLVESSSSASGGIGISAAGAYPIKFWTNSTLAATIDSSQRFIFGHTASDDGGALGAMLQVSAVNNTATVAVQRWDNTANGPYFTFANSRGASIGTHAILAENDPVGSFMWYGDDGTDVLQKVAQLDVFIEGTPAENDLGGRMVFSTRATGGAVGEAMQIDSAKNLLLNAPTVAGNLANGLAMKNGTAASASMADAVQFWAADAGGLAGHSGLHMRGEDDAANLNVVGYKEESANAETPQAAATPGTVCKFTDTDDGSGDGTYQLALDGTTWNQLA